MKYTASIDGKLRVTLKVDIRLTKEEFSELRRRASYYQHGTPYEYLQSCLREGLSNSADRYAQDIAEDFDRVGIEQD